MPDLHRPAFRLLAAAAAAAAFAGAGACAVAQGVAVASVPATAATPPAAIRRYFGPPAELAAEFGAYASPLKFHDGRPVASPAEWPARRAEILKTWHGLMGAWPALLERPRVTLSERRERAGGVIEHRVDLEVAPGKFQHGYLLTPPARFAGKRPAVLVPFYAPEVSVDYDGPRAIGGQAARYFKDGARPVHRDFALLLAQRGFVTLAIGTPGDNATAPDNYGAACQPLSLLAYLAANCHTALAQRPEVDPARIGVMGHSYGGKWAMFASCLYEKFACAVWSDGGVVFDEKRTSVNYQEPWYLGFDPAVTRPRGLVSAASPRTGAYKELVARGHDLHELHALMAPRPFLVSGGSEDFPARWVALNHAVAVNRFLGYADRVAMTNRPDHAPNAESNEAAFRFLEHFLTP
jgi:dienelactone hydrolase